MRQKAQTIMVLLICLCFEVRGGRRGEVSEEGVDSLWVGEVVEGCELGQVQNLGGLYKYGTDSFTSSRLEVTCRKVPAFIHHVFTEKFRKSVALG